MNATNQQRLERFFDEANQVECQIDAGIIRHYFKNLPSNAFDELTNAIDGDEEEFDEILMNEYELLHDFVALEWDGIAGNYDDFKDTLKCSCGCLQDLE